MKLLCACCLVLLLVSCDTQEWEDKTTGYEHIGYDLDRTIDVEAGVVCWIYDGYEGDSISCLPLADTNLRLPGE